MTLGQVNKGAIALLMLLVAIAGGFVFFQFKYKPAKTAHQAAVLAKSEAQKKLDQADLDLAAVENKGTDNSDLSRIMIAKGAIPRDEDGAEAIVQLSAIARKSGVTLRSVRITSLGGENPDGTSTASIPIELSVDAHSTYGALSLFMKMIQEQVEVRGAKIYVTGRLMNVTALELSTSEDGALGDDALPPGHMAYTLTVQAYADAAPPAAPEDPAAAAGVPGAAPAPTDPNAQPAAPATNAVTPSSSTTVPPGSS